MSLNLLHDNFKLDIQYEMPKNESFFFLVQVIICVICHLCVVLNWFISNCWRMAPNSVSGCSVPVFLI